MGACSSKPVKSLPYVDPFMSRLSHAPNNLPDNFTQPLHCSYVPKVPVQPPPLDARITFIHAEQVLYDITSMCDLSSMPADELHSLQMRMSKSAEDCESKALQLREHAARLREYSRLLFPSSER